MSFAQDAWEAIAPIRKAIDELPLGTARTSSWESG